VWLDRYDVPLSTKIPLFVAPYAPFNGLPLNGYSEQF
jgi:hypothetical protein